MGIRVPSSLRFALCAGSFVLLNLALLFAQSDLGTISGFVRDPSGAVVADAKISVDNQAGIERVVVTNESGFYTITSIPSGLYTVRVEASGFHKYQSHNNKLDASGSLSIDVLLTVGSSPETIEVTANATRLQTESASVQQLVTRQQIDSLELNGRNPVGLSALVPGARSPTLANLTFNINQGPANFNGSRNPENLITYDGAPAIRTRSNSASLGAADVDSTQEVQIMTSNYAPEYGRSSGAQIRIATKTGTNEFHGAAYEYLRNTAFNANTWVRNSNPATAFTAPIHYNQFGFNIGGPLFIPGRFNKEKRKAFFNWGEEWVKYRFVESGSSLGGPGLLLVPSVRMRQGDFGELLDPNNPYTHKVQPIKDPQSPNPCTVSEPGGCFPGNIIPPDRLSPNGIGILNAWPVPNLTDFIGGGNWFATELHTFDQRKDTVGIDVNLSDQHHLRFHAMNFAYLEYQPLDGNTDRTPKFVDRPNQTGSLNYIWTISPTKVNETLITASQNVVKIPVDTENFFDRSQACSGSPVPCNLDYQYIFPDGKMIPTRIPTVNLSPFSQLSGGPYPSRSGGPIYTVSDSFTWVKNNHTFKFGFLFERSGENDNDEINVQACPTCTNNQNGQFLFTDLRSGGTGVAVANAALGLFDTYSEIGHRAYTVFRSNVYEGFAQDSWKVRQKLTVNYGVRYTVIVPYHAEWGNMIIFDPRFYDPAQAVTIDPATGLISGSPTVDQRYNGMVIPGDKFPSSAKGRVPEASSGLYESLFRNVPDHYSDIQFRDFQPRLGIAYQLGKKMVIRAGSGRFITRLGVSDSIFLGGNPPFQPSGSVSNGSADEPGAGGAVSIPLVVTSQSKDFRNPEAWHWNFTVEREMFWKSTLSLGYVGRRGLHLQREADINQPTTKAVTANPGVNINALRPYLGFGSIRQTDNEASSLYHSLQVAWNRRFTEGFLFGVSYTFSKSEDDGSNQRDVVPNTYDTSSLWGPSEFDARHMLVFNYLYSLPFFKNYEKLAGKLFGGWQISGVTQFQTGLPCSVASATDYAGVGLDSNFGCGVNGQYWLVNGDPKIIGSFGAMGQWFATTNPDGSPIFTKPAPGTFNTQRVRNLIYQPGYQNWNLGLFKNFPIDEQRGFQFRAEAFNFINHPNWCGASGCNGTTNVGLNPANLNTFGKVLTKGSERNLQLSLRIYF